MPTPKFLAPIKDALKRDKGDDGREKQQGEPCEPSVVRDYAVAPQMLESGTPFDSHTVILLLIVHF
jgi:hypothetical protein